MINISNISKNYQQNAVITDITTTIPKNKITAFVGANGAGKSTLLNVIARLTKADAGQVLIDGKNINDYSMNEFAKKVAILKQNNHFNISLKVRELVEFGRYPHSKGKLKADDDIYIDKALALMDLTHLQNKFLNELSGGERQRAFIAMTIAQNTDYILLDEPLNNLDMKHCSEIMFMLKKLVEQENKTILIVLHDINFAAIYADYILAIKDHQLFINDEKHKIINQQTLNQIFDMSLDVIDYKDHKLVIYYHHFS